MTGLLSSSASGRASPDALVAAACHYRTVNLPTLVIGPADSVPVLAIGLVTKDRKSNPAALVAHRHGDGGRVVPFAEGEICSPQAIVQRSR